MLWLLLQWLFGRRNSQSSPTELLRDLGDVRKAKFEAAGKRFEQATRDLAAEKRFGGLDGAVSEVEMMDDATALVRGAKAARKRGGTA